MTRGGKKNPTTPLFHTGRRYRVPVSGFSNSNLPKVCCPKCTIPNEIKMIQNWKCMECKTIFFDNDKFHIKKPIDNGLGLKTTHGIHSN